MKSSRILMALAVVLPVTVAGAAKKPVKLTKDNIDQVISQMTLQEKVDMVVGNGRSKIVNGAAGYTPEIERLGIPSTIFSDGPSGILIDARRPGDDHTYYATGFPTATVLASTWNPETVEAVGAAIGREALDYGVDVVLAPGINIHRSPLCGRNFEYYGEDPLQVGKTAAAFIRGIQSNGVGVALKHFAINNQELNRCAADVRIDQRTAREIYLKGFEISIKEASPKTVMSSYNRINGSFACENRAMITDLLRGDFGFKGMVMTDWGAGVDNAAIINAGNDNIQSGGAKRKKSVLQAVEDGRISMETLDAAVKRVLEMVVASPHFDPQYVPSQSPDFERNARIARAAAAEGIVLLENHGRTLPLKPCRVALFGSAAYNWTPCGLGAADVHTSHTVDLVEGLENAGLWPESGVKKAYKAHLEGQREQIETLKKAVGHWRGASVRPSEIADVENLAKASLENSDIAFVVIGRNTAEGIDHVVDNDFNLNKDEINLILSVSEIYHKAGKKVVVILNTCSAVETASWRDAADAVVEAWQGGQQGGNALADVLTGAVNPSGRLTMTFPVKYGDVPSAPNFPVVAVGTTSNPSFYNFDEKPRYDIKDIDYVNYEEGVYVGYRHYCTRGVKTAYPFGYGLSYTTFKRKVDAMEVTADGVKITVEVKNTGGVAGREVVQLYASAPQNATSLDKPSRELKAFAKTGLIAPGASEKVVLEVLKDDFASFVEACNSWVTEAGTYTLTVAANAEDPGESLEVRVSTERVRPCKASFAPKGRLYIK